MKKISDDNFQPFVKWVGGKRDVIKNELHKYIPKKFNTYIEPFVGGGAMLCYIKPEKAIINDFNNELIAAYKIIKNNPIKLMKKLDEYKDIHNKNFYYVMRERERE